MSGFDDVRATPGTHAPGGAAHLRVRPVVHGEAAKRAEVAGQQRRQQVAAAQPSNELVQRLALAGA